MARAKWPFGSTTQQTSQVIAKPLPVPALATADAKKFGLENFGNTCYANSVLQALYFCAPFRDLLLQTTDSSIPTAPASSLKQSDASAARPASQRTPTPPIAPVRRKSERKPSSSGLPDAAVMPIPSSPPTLFSALRSLFLYISTHPAERGTVAPRAFIEKLREVNELFRSTMHQDAHEFLNYLLNKIVEEVEQEKRNAQQKHNSSGEDLSTSLVTLASKAPTNSSSGRSPEDATLVHKLFEGVLTSETRCLTCETVSSRDESFLDLSIDIEQNSSVTACLRQFSASEMLCQKNKFFCDSCCDLQEAEKRMKIKRMPNVLALHLKRFKYQEDVQRYIKLSYRVAFPFELRLFNTVDDVEDADRLYSLFGIVVHIGNGPHHGHYVSIIKTLGSWFLFDDDNVSAISESDISKYFGDNAAGAAYVLYYQAANIDLVSLGLHPPAEPTAATSTSSNSVANHSPPQPLSTSSAEGPAPHPAELSPHLPTSPPLPPGLIVNKDDAPHNDPPTSPLLSPSPQHSHHAEDAHTETPESSTVNGVDSPTLSSPIPRSGQALSGLFKTIRRAPSIKASEGRRSMASERPARPLTSPSRPHTHIGSPTMPLPNYAAFGKSGPETTEFTGGVANGTLSPAPFNGGVVAVHPESVTREAGEEQDKEKDKEKEQGKEQKTEWRTNWWGGKKKSFKNGDKQVKGDPSSPLPHARNDDSTRQQQSAATSFASSSSTWFKSSTPKQRRPSEHELLRESHPAAHARASTSITAKDELPPSLAPTPISPAASGSHRPEHLLLARSHHLRRVNGNDSTPSPTSSFDSSSLGYASHSPHDGSLPPTPVPAAFSNTVFPISAVPAQPLDRRSSFSPLLSPKQSKTTTPERKKSTPSFPSFRDKDKERKKYKPMDGRGSPASNPPRPSTAGATLSSSDLRAAKERRPLPPVPPLPMPKNDLQHQGQGQHYQHRRQSSAEDGDAHYILRKASLTPLGPVHSVEAPLSPGLGSFGTMNQSRTSNSNSTTPTTATTPTSTTTATTATTTSSSNLKRATRKLSFTAPMLGFGKKDREKDKDRDRKAAPSAYSRI